MADLGDVPESAIRLGDELIRRVGLVWISTQCVA
jgi:hypothetical protein